MAQTHYDANGLAVTAGQTGYVTVAFGFTGRYFDTFTGLQYNWHRWYDPAVGRWMSEDPIGFAGGDANLYRYVGNMPTMWIDPTGLAVPDGGDFNSRPGFRPKSGLPPGTLGIDQDPRTKGRERVHDIKNKLRKDGTGVGPPSWVGVSPDGRIWGTNPDGTAVGLGDLESLLTVGVGVAMAGVGWTMIGWGGAGSAVIVADNITVVGVADDPLLLVTGGAMVAGGALVVIGGAWSWIAGD